MESDLFPAAVLLAASILLFACNNNTGGTDLLMQGHGHAGKEGERETPITNINAAPAGTANRPLWSALRIATSTALPYNEAPP